MWHKNSWMNVFFYEYVVPGIKSRASSRLCKCSTTELSPHPWICIFYVQVWSSVDAKYKTAIHEKLTVLGSCRSCQAGQGESPNSTDKHCVQNAGERVFLWSWWRKTSIGVIGFGSGFIGWIGFGLKIPMDILLLEKWFQDGGMYACHYDSKILNKRREGI